MSSFEETSRDVFEQQRKTSKAPKPILLYVYGDDADTEKFDLTKEFCESDEFKKRVWPLKIHVVRGNGVSEYVFDTFGIDRRPCFGFFFNSPNADPKNSDKIISLSYSGDQLDWLKEELLKQAKPAARPRAPKKPKAPKRKSR